VICEEEALVLAAGEVAADVGMVVTGRPRRSRCPQRISIFKGRMQSSTSQPPHSAKTVKMPRRKRQTLLTMQKKRRRHITRRARSLILCRHLHRVRNLLEEAEEAEEVVDLEGGIGEKKKGKGTSLLSGSPVVLD
jgi:hypothetical protein